MKELGGPLLQAILAHGEGDGFPEGHTVLAKPLAPSFKVVVRIRSKWGKKKRERERRITMSSHCGAED